MTVYRGENAQLLMQREPSLRGAIVTPAATRMKFTTVTINDQEAYADDPTIDNTSPLGHKRLEVDQSPRATLECVLCLNEVGFWLSLLYGPPVTIGTGPYLHTWTLNNNLPLTALAEIGYIDASEYSRWQGVAVDTLSWDVMQKEQRLNVGMIPAVEVDPSPGVVFDVAPTAYAKNYACAKAGNIYDVQGASTLGAISQGSINFARNITPFALADGATGYGLYDIGDQMLTGRIAAHFASDSQLRAYKRNHTSIPLVIISKNAAGDASLTVNMPAVEFDKNVEEISTRSGVIIETDYRAHADGANVPTIELANGVASYA